MLKRFLLEEEGQTATEYMLLISVVVVAVIGGASLFVPQFNSGVTALASQVKKLITDGCGARNISNAGAGTNC